MAEQLDISYVIKDAVKDYIVPKHKMYRLEVCDITINYNAHGIDTLETPISKKVIEVIDDLLEYEKLINDIDEDGSGEIEYDEFRNLLSSSD